MPLQCRTSSTYICASEGRRRDFLDIQRKIIENEIPAAVDAEFWVSLHHRPLLPIQDVKTRWDSTTQMLIRFRVLRRAVILYFEKTGHAFLLPSEQEWSHIDYLIGLTAPFNALTQTVGRSASASIHRVYEIYDILFTHIESALEILQKKTTPWKVQMYNALQCAWDKLNKYYSQTERDRSVDQIYAFSWLLNPYYRNTAFTGAEWGEASGRSHYRAKYMDDLRHVWEAEYAGHDSDTLQTENLNTEDDPLTYLRPGKATIAALAPSAQRRHEADELQRYFDHCESLGILSRALLI
jgi:hypothetical protein